MIFKVPVVTCQKPNCGHVFSPRRDGRQEGKPKRVSVFLAYEEVNVTHCPKCGSVRFAVIDGE